MTRLFCVIASDGDTERCEGLFYDLGTAELQVTHTHTCSGCEKSFPCPSGRRLEFYCEGPERLPAGDHKGCEFAWGHPRHDIRWAEKDGRIRPYS